MIATNDLTKSEQNKAMVSGNPVREVDVEMTPQAEGKAANKLPKAEQFKHFKDDLAVHDSGNRPA